MGGEGKLFFTLHRWWEVKMMRKTFFAWKAKNEAR